MNLIATGDWQVSTANLGKCWMVVDDILRYAKEYEVQTVVHCGDYKNALNPVDQRVTNFMVESVRAFREHDLRLIVVMGNHDRIGMGYSTGSCAPVLSAAGAHVVTVPTEMHLLDTPYRFFLLPYQDTAQQARKQLKDWSQQASPDDSVLFLHQNIVGARMNRISAVQGTEDISVDDLYPEQYLACVSGHIHLHQKLAENVCYVGSPFATDFGESNQRKGLVLLEL